MTGIRSKTAMQKGSGNVFHDLGFSAGAAAELAVKSSLIDAISETIARRKLTQKEAAELCATDQPTSPKSFGAVWRASRLIA